MVYGKTFSQLKFLRDAKVTIFGEMAKRNPHFLSICLAGWEIMRNFASAIQGVPDGSG
jgi:hypothetical protein